MNYLLLCCLVLLSAALGCRTKGIGFDPYRQGSDGFAPVEESTNRLDAKFLKSPAEPYRLGPGDIIEVEPVGDVNPRSILALGPDGKVYYSLLPGISLWGQSIPECRATLQREMAKYNRDVPDLVINLRAAASQRVWFLGAVQTPGVYPLTAPTTLLEAIATLGGVPTGNGQDEVVDFSRSFVLRNGKFLPVNFERLIKYGDATQNIFLAPDDFIFIRPADIPSVYVVGAIGGAVLPFSRDLTVARALITLGGPVKFAQVGKVVILRGSLTSPRIAQVDYQAIVKGQAHDISLEPGDIIYVPFSPYRRAAQLVEELVDQFVRTTAVNQGSYWGAGGEQRNAGVGFQFGTTTGGGTINTGSGGSVH
jgi:protein involved in polysaccharide export with SLBB domain